MKLLRINQIPSEWFDGRSILGRVIFCNGMTQWQEVNWDNDPEVKSWVRVQKINPVRAVVEDCNCDLFCELPTEDTNA